MIKKKRKPEKYLSSKCLLISLMSVGFILSCTLLFGQGINQKLVYNAYNDDGFDYTMVFTSQIDEKDNFVNISTTRTGQKFLEENKTILDKRNKILKINQLYTDYKKKEVNHWSVNNSTIPAQSKFRTIKKKDDPISFFFPESGYTFQALMYILQTSMIVQKKEFEFNFLLPPANFYSMTAKVVSTEKVKYLEQEHECYKLEVSLNNPLSIVMPKIYFWLTTSAPHLLLKYKDYSVTAMLEQQILLPINGE